MSVYYPRYDDKRAAILQNNAGNNAYTFPNQGQKIRDYIEMQKAHNSAFPPAPLKIYSLNPSNTFPDTSPLYEGFNANIHYLNNFPNINRTYERQPQNTTINACAGKFESYPTENLREIGLRTSRLPLGTTYM